MANVYLICLKAKIKGLAEAGSRSRKLINATAEEKRGGHWSMKRKIGVDARHHIVAYGLLRGISYEQIEPWCGVFNPPSAETVLNIIQQHSSWYDKNKWTLDVVKDKLARKKPVDVAL